MSTISASTTSTTGYVVTSDTTGTLVLQTGATPTTAVTVASNQQVTFAQPANLPNTFGFKNRIINGGMVIDQRNAGASVTVNSGVEFYAVDRFIGQGQSADGVFTIQRSSIAPTGFQNSLLATVTTADASIGSTQFYFLQQKIEGFNVADFSFGSAAAQSVTLSFWVRSSVTGTFAGSLSNSAANRSYPFTYTINAANTWEQKAITIAGDTSGTWLTNNDVGLRVYWNLGAGSSYTASAGAWANQWAFNATGATNLIATNGATFYITGVQLEKGSTATSFDFRPYGTELALCQRYFIKWTGNSSATEFPMIGTGLVANSTQGYVFIPTPVTLRAAPTLSYSGQINLLDATGIPPLTSITTTYVSGANGLWAVVTGSAGGLTAGRGLLFYPQNASANSFSASSEL